MSQIFPRWFDKVPFVVTLGLGITMIAVIGFFWYYGSPKFTEVGYRPAQPVQYSHKLHAGDLGIDCRYCHFQVESSPHANIPTTSTCMNCHRLIGTDNEKLLPVRESWSSKKPIKWIRVHNLPDYAYFNHSAHLNAGVNCKHCHGNVAQAELVALVEPMSMGWCLDCHRNPDNYIGPRDKITDMNWKTASDQMQFAQMIRETRDINPREECSACHR